VKVKRINTLREMTPEDLQNELDNKWAELFGLKIKHALGQLENPLTLRALRRDIARIKTLLHQHGVEEHSIRRREAGARAATAAAAGKKKRAASGKRGSSRETAEAAGAAGGKQ
jgi:large subunit ribosomal protein L29